MVFEIEGEQYTGFGDYDADKLKTAPTEVRIAWLEERLRLVLTRAMDQVFKRDAPNHQVVNTVNMTFYLAGVTLIACAIEALGSLLSGDGGARGDSNRNFKAWIRKYMNEWDVATPAGDLVSWLWDRARCGLAHQLGFKSGGVEWPEGCFKRLSDGQFEINADKFYDDFKTGIGAFLKDLRNHVNGDLRQGFDAQFRRMFLADR